jgi:iron complex transport system permease protein
VSLARKLGSIAAFGVFAALVLVIAPTFGYEHIGIVRVLTGSLDANESRIFWDIRVPRVLMGFLAGSGLAISGMAFQALFRNPLATPFTLGVSSGAALGASLYIHLGLVFSAAYFAGTALFAFAGAAAAITIVYGLTRLKRGMSTTTMLLAGVAVNYFFSSLILVIQYRGGVHRAFRVLRWVMGGVEVVGFTSVLQVLPFVFTGIVAMLFLVHELNLMTTGEDIAASRGVNVARTKLIVFFAASLMVAGIVSICGPIGFVGMMIPHVCRLVVGWEHRVLAPATALLGGAFLVVCDTVARTAFAPTELPVGIITALIGGPFFLWLLVGRSLDGRTMQS